MAGELVLVVDDDPDILQFVRMNLEMEGFVVATAGTGAAALESSAEQVPELILLDVMMPEMDGLAALEALRSQPLTANVPVVLLTAKALAPDRVAGLNKGADDYITKPFSVRVFMARVRSVLRRRNTPTVADGQRLRIGNVEIHPGRHEVVVAGETVDMTATEFRILHFLAKRPGWVFTRNQIVDGIRGANYAVTDRSVDVQIVSLRRKLGDHAAMIQTVRGVGYRCKE